MGGKPKFKPSAKPNNTIKQDLLSKTTTTSTEDTIPENWPQDIKFLTDHAYTPAALELQPKLSRAPSDNSSDPWTKVQSNLIHPITPHIQITTITSPTHPACGQRGLFAASDLPPDSFILLYLGLVHTNSLSDTDPHSDYDLSLDREIGLSVDASTMANESRCANDYRGVAERPNAEFRDCYVQVPSEKRADGVRWERRVGIFVLSAGKVGNAKRRRGILKGEEVLVSYGKGFWEGRQLLGMFRKDDEMARTATLALEH
ncbi:hypothetical protein CB0940_10407 [Cercospora beticola]|uniref:SET domain-containing protein n=1 Tax=Cercospora beticola TaxID=122368 RepID=A0A2G5HV61_CERBT|nr:hypothetical protein CB0940_10407 [Cercospora beticola]PIA96430.1 hypothetical protein CB0940_10407 [Cercospora beticola]WPB07124.1 hypothetical protein RHO25_011784 [Cercospora beticola]CAK1367078.1 unnamed protein product [Cercospora beticola]